MEMKSLRQLWVQNHFKNIVYRLILLTGISFLAIVRPSFRSKANFKLALKTLKLFEATSLRICCAATLVRFQWVRRHISKVL